MSMLLKRYVHENCSWRTYWKICTWCHHELEEVFVNSSPWQNYVVWRLWLDHAENRFWSTCLVRSLTSWWADCGSTSQFCENCFQLASHPAMFHAIWAKRMAASKKSVDSQTKFDWSLERGRILHHIFCVVPRSVLVMSQVLMKKNNKEQRRIHHNPASTIESWILVI